MFVQCLKTTSFLKHFAEETEHELSRLHDSMKAKRQRFGTVIIENDEDFFLEQPKSTIQGFAQTLFLKISGMKKSCNFAGDVTPKLAVRGKCC